MKVVPDKGSNKHWYDCACQFSLRHILFLFLFLLFLVILNFLASTSKLNLVLDVSMKMKSDVVDVFNNFIDIDKADSINATFSIRSIVGEDVNSRGRNDNAITGFILKEVKVKHTQGHESNSDNIKEYPISDNLPWYLQNHSLSQKAEESKERLEHTLSPNVDRHKSVYNTDTKVFIEGAYNVTSGNSSENRMESSTYINVLGNYFHSSDNKRKDTCDTCFQHNFNYVIDNPVVCKLTSPSQTIDIIILITTVHKNFKNRNALRQTWLSPYRNNSGNIRYAFLLGEISNLELRKQVREENDVYRDIIKEDFTDSYMNLTYKSVMGFKWASTKCSQARFVLKTDDDMFVNIYNLLNVVKTHGDRLQTALGGSCNLNARPIRNKKSKWYASFSSYPKAHYPGFCSGTGYVTSMNVAEKIYEISPSVPFFHLEDVYSALCIRKLGYDLIPIQGFNVGRPRLDPCIYKSGKLVTAHQLTPLMLHMIFRRQCVPRQPRRTVPLGKKHVRH